MSKTKFENKDGKLSFVVAGDAAGKSPWFGIGKSFINKPVMTAAEAIKGARMNFKVELQGLKTATGKKVPDRFATVRTDTGEVLGVVGDRYKIIQNIDAFGFFDTIIDRDEAIYTEAGVLGNGERIFLNAKLPNDITIKGDKIEKYLFLITSHDGRSPLYVGFVPERVFCGNQLSGFLKNMTNKVVVRHTTNAQEKIQEAAKVMGLASKYMNTVKGLFNQMANKKITDKKLLDFILASIVPKKEILTKEELDKEYSVRATNAADEIFEFAKTHETQMTDATKGTLFGAYNSISGYYNFNNDYVNNDARMRDLMFGSTEWKSNNAFKLAVSMI